MVCKASDILEQMAPELDFPQKQSVVIAAPPLEWIRPALEPTGDPLFSGFGRFWAKDDKQPKSRDTDTFRLSGRLREKATDKR
jgi:hypothetical protein